MGPTRARRQIRQAFALDQARRAPRSKGSARSVQTHIPESDLEACRLGKSPAQAVEAAGARACLGKDVQPLYRLVGECLIGRLGVHRYPLVIWVLLAGGGQRCEPSSNLGVSDHASGEGHV